MIVGAGVAGLTAASLLAHNVPATIFEANDKVGGCCASATLDGFTFHDGAVFLGIIDLLDHAFARIGLKRVELVPLRRITANSSTTLPDGTVVNLRDGSDLTVTGRAVDVSRLQGELRRMCDKWQPVLRFAGEELLRRPFSSWRMLRRGWRYLHKLRGTVASKFNRLFSVPRVKLIDGEVYRTLPSEEATVQEHLRARPLRLRAFRLPCAGCQIAAIGRSSR